ncbi:MAG: hypothetical protein A2Z45_09250 [Chloroflexi bacterium RBG_19FT_COMBO_55_16]|nr:MAG: hypothetical protein A2Z45_09250 [Chloroflexi bacterium RBG_19FT_COMBO_55_16]
MADLVECHSGFAYADRPTALRWKGERLEVAMILKSWLTPTGKCFRVRTIDDRTFELIYDLDSDQWSVLNTTAVESYDGF